MNLELAMRSGRGLRLDDVSFPEKLLEVLATQEVRAPELNPVARVDAVRFVNGLPRASRAPSWFEAPPAVPNREAVLERFLARSDRGDLPEPQQRLVALLAERRTARRGVRAALMQTSLSTREP